MSVRQEIPVISRLAAPVVMGNLGLMLMGVVDVLLVTRLGTGALAAVTLGNVWVFGTIFPACGVLLGMDPIVTQAHGAGDGARCGLALQRALILSIPLSALVAVAWLVTGPCLRVAGQDHELARLAHEFVAPQVWSIPFMFVLFAVRQYLAGRGIMAPAMWVSWIANLVNLVAGWALIFGHFGCPALGVRGAGLAMAISRTFMGVALVAWVLARRLHALAWVGWVRDAWLPRGFAELLGHGLPTGGQMALEIWGFSATTLLAGRLGAAELAAHSIVLNMASVSFMVPMGISIAAATRVGNLTGAGDEREARLACRVALGLGASVMLVSAAMFTLLRWQLPAWYGAEAGVITLAASILPVAATFQVFDGTQVVGCGVLRGRADTQPAFWFNVIGYWVLGLPCAWLLAFRGGMGLPGLWWGLVLGLATVAVLLTARILRRH